MGITYGADLYGDSLYGGLLVEVPAFVATELVLDPIEVSGGRTALSLNSGAIKVGDDGPDWGDAQVEAYMAEQSRGSLPVDYRIPNRTITIPLLLGASGSAGYRNARKQLHSKVALIQQEGGWLKRGDAMYADIVNATINTPDKWGWRGLEPDVVLTLEAVPDFYGDEVDLGLHTETSLNELTFVETGIEGDYPGRVRIQVTEADGDAQSGLFWSIRSRFYDSSPKARMVYAGTALTPVGSAGVVTGDPAGIRHTNLGTNWTPVLLTDLPSAGDLTHVGSYRILARVYSLDGPNVQARLVWDVGDLTLPEDNRPVKVPGSSGYYIVDLGSVRLDEPPVGNHRWSGQIQGKGAVGGEDLTVNRLWVLNNDEGFGTLRAATSVESAYSAPQIRDEFTAVPAGGLTGKTLPSGQSWGGTGPSDFVPSWTVPSVDPNQILRQAIDTPSGSINPGRFALVNGATMTDTVVQSTISRYGVAWADQQVVARYSNNSSGSFRAGVSIEVTPGGHQAYLKVMYGTTAVLDKIPFPIYGSYTYTVRLQVDAAGRWAVYSCWGLPSGLSGTPQMSGQEAILATGGSLASGQVGLYDATYEGSSNTSRLYDNFLAYAPDPADVVLHPNRKAELRWDGMYRETADGSAYGPVSHVTGDLPRIPASTLEGRPVEFLIKGSRGDIGSLPDQGVDDVSARVFYRPSWLFKS